MFSSLSCFFEILKMHFVEFVAGTNAHGYNEMQLMPEPLYAVPTDNVQMLAIKGTDNGRIFMAGRDGCLYEIEYQVMIIFIIPNTTVLVLQFLLVI